MLGFAQQAPLIRLVEEPDDPHFGAIAIDFPSTSKVWQDFSAKDWEHVLKVYPVQKDSTRYGELPSMLGEVALDTAVLYFVPRFPLIKGKEYLVVLEVKKAFEEKGVDWPKDRQSHFRKTIQVPASVQIVPTFVENVYPSTPLWSANQLKFYIYFSAPMRFGEASKYIHLLDENGQQVADPFLLAVQELWDKERKRLTVWFDPGRIKRGLIPNIEKGPPLQAGKEYQLIIRKEWEDQRGQPLQEDYTKIIQVGAADRQKPRPEDWLIVPPKPGTTGPVRVLFTEPMDHGLLHSAIAVVDENEQILKGETSTKEKEQEWWFHPVHAWTAGNYRIRVSYDLEDLAGNNLRRLFDADVEIGGENRSVEVRPYVELLFWASQKETKK